MPISRALRLSISKTISNFVFLFCDTQLNGFSVIFIGSKWANSPFYFVFCAFCEIENYGLTVMAEPVSSNTGYSQHSCRTGLGNAPA